MFRIKENHHQGMMTCTVTEITFNCSKISCAWSVFGGIFWTV